MFKRALVSVANKEGLVEFIKPFVEQGMTVVSTGGTAEFLKNHGIPIQKVSEQTEFPEVLDGRVKTLHPKIHMGLLARGDVVEDMATLKSYSVEPFDLVVGNLYPFEEALKRGLNDKELTEFIDIGGPSFLRAAAKNYLRITTVCRPEDYSWVLEKKGSLTLNERKLLASKTFYHVASYDSMIARVMCGDEVNMPELSLGGSRVQELRYGENPQQKAIWCREWGRSGLHEAEVLQGKALSYNNILDLDAALSTLSEFSETCCVSLKHNNPCGVAIGDSVGDVVKASLNADPVSVFGGILAVNKEVDEASARAIGEIFIECVVAPSFSSAALEVLSKKKNLRLLKWPQLNLKEVFQGKSVRTIAGGFLVQQKDQVASEWNPQWQILGETPSEELRKTLLLAWKVCAHLKSNAISIASGNQTLGLGMGQVNRVDSVVQAIQRAGHFHKESSDWVLASDAFFPFPDSIDQAAQAGIKWIIQPGGSLKDSEVFERAKDLGVNLIITGQRHFLH